MLDRILAGDKKPPKSDRLNFAAFCALKDEIQEALDGNVTLKTIHQTLVAEGRLSISETTFRDYCRRENVRKRPKDESPQRTKPATPRPGPVAVKRVTKDDDDLV